MSSHFPYVKLRGKYLPIIPLKIKGESGWLIYNAFVDSGAGYSVFQSDVAEDLNLELEGGTKQYVTVGDGLLIIIYIHRLDVQIGAEAFEAEIGFSRQLGIGFNIIGRRNVFDRFKICFNEEQKLIEFHEKSGEVKS